MKPQTATAKLEWKEWQGTYSSAMVLLVMIGIPVYLLLVHSRIYYHIPGTLKRMGMGIHLTTFSLAASLAMEVVVHAKVKGIKCMFAGLTHSFSMGNSIHNKSDYVCTSLPLYKNIYFFSSHTS